MLKIIQHFGKHCSCHLQGKYVMVGCFWIPCIGQTIGEEMDLKVLIGGVEEHQSAPTNPALHLLPALQKMPNIHVHHEDVNCNDCQNVG
jgi:hypothetical protein